MSWLQTVTPTNLWIEKEKFFADQTYNPQFEYTEEISEEFISKYGKPDKKNLELAQEILDRAFFGRNEQDLLMMQGKVISPSEVEEKFNLFLRMHNLHHQFPVIWSQTAVSRATAGDKITLKSNAQFREKDTLGLIYHEVGTHILRKVNYEQQPWYKKKKEHKIIHSHLATEEGLACLHALMPQAYKLAHTTALRYLANNYSLTHSFSELWNYLTPYISDYETRWMVASRQKRGITDTSHPGAFSKDIVYFEGLIEVWRWLKNNDFNPTKLYFGKCSWRDVEIAISLNQTYKPLMPSFYTASPDSYQELMQEIGNANFLQMI